MNEGSYKNIPDPTFSFDFVKSTITRKITQNVDSVTTCNISNIMVSLIVY